MIETPVLIVGGGPVGLTASILLPRFGVPSLLVERHPGTAVHPKARGINIRTMEIFRQCGAVRAAGRGGARGAALGRRAELFNDRNRAGDPAVRGEHLDLEHDVRAAGLAQDRVRFIIWAESLTGRELERRMPARMRPDVAKLSAVTAALCAQDDLEPVLRRHAESLTPGALRFSTELAGLEQDAEGAVAMLAGGERLRARWVIAADGSRTCARRSSPSTASTGGAS